MILKKIIDAIRFSRAYQKVLADSVFPNLELIWPLKVSDMKRIESSVSNYAVLPTG
jgi:hypothetical protein